MLTIEKIDTTSTKQVNRFVNLPYRLYAGHAQWVPPLLGDAKLYLNRHKHFFYQHSEADFFIAARDGRDVGRIAMLDHRRFNDYHGTHQAQFYLFDCEDDQEVAAALFAQAFAWAKNRGLTKIIGPKGFGTLDPFGVLVEGFEHRQMMTMSNYNYPYYQTLVEAAGFSKEVDFSSFYLDAQTLRLPAWIRRTAELARQKGELQVQSFETLPQGGLLWLALLLHQLNLNLGFSAVRAGLSRLRQGIEIYNQSMVKNWEYYPLSPVEITAMINDLKWIINPSLPKIITYQDEVVGVLLALPDVSAPLQRAQGRLTPWATLDLLKTIRRPQWIVLAGFGILPQFRLQGGPALILAELEKTVIQAGVQHVELHQVADTAAQVGRDLETVGLKPYKKHRVYVRTL